jgi:hypothetical protein
MRDPMHRLDPSLWKREGCHFKCAKFANEVIENLLGALASADVEEEVFKS